MDTITKDQRDAIAARAKAVRDFLGNRTSYLAAEVAHLNPPTNDETAQAELFDWMHEKPSRAFLYPFQDTLTNWTGIVFARITHSGREYRSNLGDKRRSVRAIGINGVAYAGTIYETYARMKATK